MTPKGSPFVCKHSCKRAQLHMNIVNLQRSQVYCLKHVLVLFQKSKISLFEDV